MSATALYQLPAGWSVDPNILEFFNKFYRISDSPDSSEHWIEMFAPDATFILASRTSVGRKDILTTRLSMWSTVSSRLHTVLKIFPFGPAAHEFMLYGTVKYTSKAGEQSEKDWAARAELSNESDGEWRMKFYQIYLDTGSRAK